MAPAAAAIATCPYDACIIGGGLSGLAAARELLLRDPCLKVLVLEARPRLGGRTCSVALPDGGAEPDGVDLGGQWVGPKQPRMLDLIDTYQIPLVRQTWFDGPMPQSDFGNCGGGGSLVSGASGAMNALEEEEMERIVRTLDTLAQTVTGAPWADVPRAAEWDALSSLDWLQANIQHDAVLREMILFVQTAYAAEPKKISFLNFLFEIRAAGGIAQLGDGDGGAQTWRLRGGAQQVSDCLAEDVRKRGGDVLLEQPVQSVAQSEDGVTVETKAGDTFQARRVIMALPPPLWRTIEFSPPLPAPKMDISKRMCVPEARRACSAPRPPPCALLCRPHPPEPCCLSARCRSPSLPPLLPLSRFCPLTQVHGLRDQERGHLRGALLGEPPPAHGAAGGDRPRGQPVPRRLRRPPGPHRCVCSQRTPCLSAHACSAFPPGCCPGADGCGPACCLPGAAQAW